MTTKTRTDAGPHTTAIHDACSPEDCEVEALVRRLVAERVAPVSVQRLEAWAGCVQRLIAVAPIAVVIDETGIDATGHSTPPERAALREQARATVERWLARDLAVLTSTED